MGWLTLTFKVKFNLKVKIYPILSVWVCPRDKSPLIEVRISKFGQKMHLSTVKVPIDFGIDWPWSSVLFLISNRPFLYDGLVGWDCNRDIGPLALHLQTRMISLLQLLWLESSTYWQFFYYRPPGKFRVRSLKCDAKNSTYMHIIYITLSVNRYGFSLPIGNTKNHVATLICLEWLLKYVNISIILAPKLMSHACALLIGNVGNYLYLNNGTFKFEVDPHQPEIPPVFTVST